MSTIRELFGLEQVVPFIEGTGPIMGMEIEAEHLGHGIDWYRRRALAQGWGIDTDGSLRGQNTDRRAGVDEMDGNAFEFISKPMPASALAASLDGLYRECAITERSFESDRTSIHVHVNVQDKTTEYLRGLVYLYAAMERCLFNFVGADRDKNIYCVPLHSTVYLRTLNYWEKQKNPAYIAKTWQKYTALNLVPMLTYGTVEFRHMHGTADLYKLRQWLLILTNLFNVADKPFEELREQLFALNTTCAYEDLFNQVFGGIVPYTDEYSELLEEGILTAKMSELQPSTPAVARPTATLWATPPEMDEAPDRDEDDEEELLAEAAEQRRRNDARTQMVRLRRAAQELRGEFVTTNIVSGAVTTNRW